MFNVFENNIIVTMQSVTRCRFLRIRLVLSCTMADPDHPVADSSIHNRSALTPLWRLLPSIHTFGIMHTRRTSFINRRLEDVQTMNILGACMTYDFQLTSPFLLRSTSPRTINSSTKSEYVGLQIVFVLLKCDHVGRRGKFI